jgi:predicted aspartyl protease
VGSFNVTCRIENHLDRIRAFDIDLMVDTGSEHTWAPKRSLEKLGVRREKRQTFVLANGQEITRSVGFAIVRVGQDFTIDEVVFAEPGDLQLLGARTIEGLNVTVDPTHKRLVRAAPPPTGGPIRLRR